MLRARDRHCPIALYPLFEALFDVSDSSLLFAKFMSVSTPMLKKLI
jgi:membrane-associated HD superfamily phosphohydrolase